MNESEKNIETCLPESILAEVASVPNDPQFVSLVNESLDPLKQQAVQQASSDAYNEVVASHQPYTFTSSVRQMKSNLILLLRRLWRFPFGSGTIRSLSDMWAHYITRLQGSETYGIPSRLDQLTDLPSAPLLVADRKICGVPEAEDGMSLVQLLCAANSITEVTDNTTGWNMTKAIPWTQLSGLTKIKLGCKTSSVPIASTDHGANANITDLTLDELEDATNIIAYGIKGKDTMTFPKLKTSDAYANGNYQAIFSMSECRVLSLPSLESYTRVGNNYWLKDMPILEELYMENLTGLCVQQSGLRGNHIGNCPKLWKVVYGAANRTGMNTTYASLITGCPKLRHLEFKAGVSCNIGLLGWVPDSETLAHQDFLTNFRSFIVLRLANRKTTTALTLTLSAAVYNAVTGANSGWASQHTLADLGITDNDLTDLETELGITSATIYATWLDTYTGANGIHWNVNKAN